MPDAFTEIYEDNARYVYNIALKMLNFNKTDAEDITQEVFIKLRDSLAFFRGTANIKTYIYRMTVNKCIDHIRRHQSQISRAENMMMNRHISSSDNLILESLLNTLTPRQKAAVLLFEIAGFSQKEVAQILGTSISSIKTEICRSIKKMAETAALEE